MDRMSEQSREASDMLAAAIQQMDGILAGSRPVTNGHAETKLSSKSSSSSGHRDHHLRDHPREHPREHHRDHREHRPHHQHHHRHSSSSSNQLEKPASSPKVRHWSPHHKASKLADDLKNVMEQVEDKNRFVQQLPAEKQAFFKSFLQQDPTEPTTQDTKSTSMSGGTAGGTGGHDPSLGDKVRRLESDKESLMLQVSVLTDQVEAQGDKISDLLRNMDDSRGRLRNAERRLQADMCSTPKKSTAAIAWKEGFEDLSPVLHKTHNSNNNELVSRTALETHKLDLMAEISTLKIRLASCEKDRRDMEDKLLLSQRKIDDLQARLNDKTIECAELRAKHRNGTIHGNGEPTVYVTLPRGYGSTQLTRDSWRRWSFNDSRNSLNNSADGSRDRTLEKEKTLERLKRKHTEVEKLKKAVESLMAANEEKERHIEELRRTMKKYRRVEEMIASSHGRKDLLTVDDLDRISDSSSTHNSSSSNENAMRDMHQVAHNPLERLEIVEPGDHRLLPNPSATSTPVNHHYSSTLPGHYQHANSPPSTILNHYGGASPNNKSPNIGRSSSAENMSPHHKTPPTVRRRPPYGTLPNSAPSSAHSSHRKPPLDTNQPRSAATTPRSGTNTPVVTHQKRPSRFASFGKGLFKLRSGRWSSSAPDLGDQLHEEDEMLKDEYAQEYKALADQNQVPQHPTMEKKKQKGFKKFFGKLRRSNSQDFEDGTLESFRRSGLRATAGPRLGWSKDSQIHDFETPFPRWDSDRVSVWMHHVGLSMYVGECKRWVKNGEQLLRASSNDLEKELGMKNHYHRKKLQLALQAIGSDTRGPMDDLDHNWVTRWLDDIGLPQYKDMFSDARVDARMLHYMTVDDLVGLKVTNSLHHLSIKSGIQVLRQNNFNPACLKRRPAPDEHGPLQNIPLEVILWTNHRVMEWLRTIDLSEYAPNLRGSGVHGGLMVLEPKFGAEVFASILSIAPNKTLLRRHLNTHFVTLIGSDTQHKKREVEAKPGNIPLTPNQKVKLKKRLFGHKRTTSDPNFDDLIAPVANGQSNGSAWKEQKQHMLAKDQFLDNVPTSDV